jgi:hypothetical protein
VNAFGPADLLRMGWRTVRDYPGRVLVPAFWIFGVLSTLDAAVEHFAADAFTSPLWRVSVVVLSAAASLGIVFYSGLLDRLVGAAERDRPPPPLRGIVRSVPWGRLIGADAIVLLVGLVGDALLVFPGLIVFTLFAIVGPLINMQGHGVVSAFVRSASLVRTKFWTTLVMVTLPVAIEHELLDAIEIALADRFVVGFVVLYALAGIATGTFAGLMEIALAEHLAFGASGPDGPRRHRRDRQDVGYDPGSPRPQGGP